MKTEKNETRRRLLDSAIDEFANEGYEKATVRSICKSAKVNINAVRYHFGDKMGLYVAAVELAHQSFAGELPRPPEATEDPLEDLRSIVSRMLAMAMSDGKSTTPHELLMLREMANPTKATETIARSFIKPQFDHLDSVLGKLLPPGAPAIERNLLAISVIGQCMHFKFGRQMDRLVIPKREYRKFTKTRLLDHIMRVTCAAISDFHENFRR